MDICKYVGGGLNLLVFSMFLFYVKTIEVEELVFEKCCFDVTLA